jgi:autotransporter adhesin
MPRRSAISRGPAPAPPARVDATALGYRAEANALNALALGASSSASGENAVALGKGSVATEANTVSLGIAGGERRLVNVAAGNVAAGSTDGVTGGQLFDTNQSVAAAQGTANTAVTNAAAAQGTGQ